MPSFNTAFNRSKMERCRWAHLTDENTLPRNMWVLLVLVGAWGVLPYRTWYGCPLHGAGGTPACVHDVWATSRRPASCGRAAELNPTGQSHSQAAISRANVFWSYYQSSQPANAFRRDRSAATRGPPVMLPLAGPATLPIRGSRDSAFRLAPGA